MASLLKLFAQEDSAHIEKHEVVFGIPMIPTYFYNYGIGWMGHGGTLGPSLMLSRMTANHAFFPPVNISYRRTMNEKRKTKLQAGIIFYQVPNYYNEAGNYLVKKQGSYLFLNMGMQRKLNKSEQVDICWGYDLFFSAINPQLYVASDLRMENLHTFLFGPDIGLSLNIHITRNWFLQIEQYMLLCIADNKGTITSPNTPPKKERWEVNIIFPKLLATGVGYKF
jgi:hypothetical protein